MIVIPMAGLSSRFFKAGYNLPKYQLLLGKETLFSSSVKSFKRYFQEEHFLFIIRDVYDTQKFVKDEIKKLGIQSYSIHILNQETEGQAETVYLGLKSFDKLNESLYIFNIDSIRYDYCKPSCVEWASGYLEVFQGEGNHWSFIQPDENQYGMVIRTTEKERISDYCSDGLYFFKSIDLFNQYFEIMKEKNIRVNGELYIAPMYNLMIERNLKIAYDLIELNQIDFSGTPDEYSKLKLKT